MKLLLAILFPMALLAQPKTYSQDGVSVDSYRFADFKPMLEQTDDAIHVVNFWATWCAPCIKELPAFEAVNKKYDNVKVLLVSLDFSSKIESALLKFIKKKNLKSDVVHLVSTDANEWVDQVNENWSGSIPATVIYTKNKRKFYERSFTQQELEEEIKSFLTP